MMSRFIPYAVRLSLMIGVLASCSGLRTVPKGDRLYTGATIDVQSSLKPQKSETMVELRSVLSPEPNLRVLGMRPAVAIHGMFEEPEKKKGLLYFMKYKIGKPPVLMSTVQVENVRRTLSNRLYQRGYFNNQVEASVSREKRTASVTYTISPNQLFTIDSLHYPSGSSDLKKKIKGLEETSSISQGAPYNLEHLKQERIRIADELKDEGYFFFNDKILLYRADSTKGQGRIQSFLDIKSEATTKMQTPYYLKRVYVHTDYNLEDYQPDTTEYEDLTLLVRRDLFKPKAIARGVFVRPGQLYTYTNHRYTQSYLAGYGAFRYTEVRFSETDEDQQLDAHVYLVPQTKYSVSAEVATVASTNNFAGPGGRLTFRDRNLFRGGEQLSINLYGRFEVQFAGEDTGNTTLEFGVDSKLQIPHLIPIEFPKVRQYVPLTEIGVGTGFFNRLDLYTLSSANASYGFSWRTRPEVSHRLRPIDISFTKLTNSTEEFQDFLDRNPGVARSFEQQFIVGTNYSFIYTELFKQNKRWRFYFEGNGELSGNALYLSKRIAADEKPTEEDPYQLFGVPFSQYVRLQPEIRTHTNLGKKDHLLAARLIVGAAIPYGNSTAVPFVKQFFVGGTNSLRGFRARSVGPGIYKPADSLSNVFIDQTGDIKLEVNVEYRFPIFGLLKGATFLEGGNVWLVNEDESRPGGQFVLDQFLGELAVDTGLGIRLDLSVVVVRLDLAFPLRKPWRDEDDRWVVGEINPFSKRWRQENLVLNFAVGMPF